MHPTRRTRMSKAVLAAVVVTSGALACGAPDEDGRRLADSTRPEDEIQPRADSASAEASGSAPLLADEPLPDSLAVPGWDRLREPWFGDLEAMVERRIIRAVVAYSKTLFFLDGARPHGITYEGLTRFEEYLNDRLESGHLKVHVVIVPMPRDQLLSAIVDGHADIAAANLTITPDRLELVDFSDSLLSDVAELLVTGASSQPLETLADLAGLEVHVRRSSSYFGSLTGINERLEEAGLDAISIETADEVLEAEDLLELVNAGIIPATVVDRHIADLWVQVFEDITVHEEFPVRTGGDIGWAIRKQSPELKAILADFATEHRAGTLFGNLTLRRYLGDAEYITNPAASDRQRRLEEVRPVFEEYAAQYGFDPLLITAQAYQESGLDQSVVSPSGALGIMQIKPSTAADPNVGIEDISELENNVHAGVRYLRFLSDRYFFDAALDPLDRHFFAFAAYNAGAARVARLRTEAAELGLDPNRWFGNVERVAARRIGRETVQYVSNIYKYHLAYRRIRDLERLRAAERVDGR